MSTTQQYARDDLRRLALSWDRSLRALDRSPNTRAAYGECVKQFIDYCVRAGHPITASAVLREHVEGFLIDLKERGKAPATLNKRYMGLRSFFGYLVEEEEIEVSPMAKMKPPQIPEKPVPIPAADDLKKLLKACDGKTFADRRDLALIMLLIDSGLRRDEAATLTLDNVDLDADVVVVMGKGRRVRSVPFGAKVGKAIDRYLRVRADHPLASSDAVWLGPRGPLTGSGVAQIVEKRCAKAEIAKIHPHQFRHAFSDAWLDAGGDGGDLMRLTGWKTRSMLDRYGAANADKRSHAAFAGRSFADRL